MTSLVLNISSHDRPGIMSRLSNVINEGGGNWTKSRTARLAGQFVGIICIDCPKDQVDSLTSQLEALSDEGIIVHVLPQGDISDYPFTKHLKIEINGNDRPGIVSQVTKTISQAGANIEELNTSIESAAMSGHPIFNASGIICLPESSDVDSVIEAIEKLSDDLTIEVELL